MTAMRDMWQCPGCKLWTVTEPSARGACATCAEEQVRTGSHTAAAVERPRFVSKQTITYNRHEPLPASPAPTVARVRRCKNGHAMTAENSYTHGGRTSCKACRRETWMAHNKAAARDAVEQPINTSLAYSCPACGGRTMLLVVTSHGPATGTCETCSRKGAA